MHRIATRNSAIDSAVNFQLFEGICEFIAGKLLTINTVCSMLAITSHLFTFALEKNRAHPFAIFLFIIFCVRM